MTFIVFLLMSLIGGSNAPLVKLTVNQFPPVILVALRAILATLIILLFIHRQKSKVKIADNWKYLLLANLLFAGNWLFFAIGIQFTSVIVSQIIYVPTALIVAILSFLFLKEKLSKNQGFGLALTLFGMSIIIYGSVKSQDILSFGTPIGNFLVILGLLCWSTYTVISRKISQVYTPLTMTFFNFLVTSMVASLLIPLEVSQKVFRLSNITFGGILGLLALALFSSVMFFYLYQWLIKHTSAFISSLVLYLTAIFGSLAGIIFFGERLTFNLIIGGVLVLAGVFIATSYNYAKKYLKI